MPAAYRRQSDGPRRTARQPAERLGRPLQVRFREDGPGTRRERPPSSIEHASDEDQYGTVQRLRHSPRLDQVHWKNPTADAAIALADAELIRRKKT